MLSFSSCYYLNDLCIKVTSLCSWWVRGHISLKHWTAERRSTAIATERTVFHCLIRYWVWNTLSPFKGCHQLSSNDDKNNHTNWNQTNTGLVSSRLWRGLRTRFVKPSQACPHSKQKRIPSTNIAAPPIIMVGIFIKQPVMNTVIPPKRIKPGNRTMLSVRQIVLHRADLKQLKTGKQYLAWLSPPWLTLRRRATQVGSSSSIVSAQFLLKLNLTWEIFF